MPRQPRIHAPGLFHHVMARGIEGRNIFRDKPDHENFLDRLGGLLAQSGAPRLYAWALMANHVHLLLQPTDTALPTMMRRLLTGYAVRFNLRHKRQGHLFQNRYKSLVVEEETYFLELVRYIHLNPVRAGALASLEELENYPYAGHAALVGQKARVGQEVEAVLSRFSATRNRAVSAYRDFVADGIGQGTRLELGHARGGNQAGGGGDPRILGGKTFTDAVLACQGREKSREKITIEDILAQVSRHTGITVDEILGVGRSRSVSAARAQFFERAHKETGATLTELARMSGRTHVAGIKAIRKRRAIEDRTKVT
ncbi:REP element-mobilizing transposase RayT [Geoalkalibacter ferrihydriticus]|uniref:Transposase n=2 Tax=Geoalkalibacter ferrihydriticus TaxID=392333 RepID=A0A0C2HZK1_9BACT|nr:transposase [Geoalkalibacter ferrihydriticus]KIH78137.1 hypothetical protein GFER_06085 [Geoalkalibacter ferrihydriticus DSM 17813]SDM80625.1 REP element-mobilizing transposase RayT [Geoalkalibacter ferrihydriticus]